MCFSSELISWLVGGIIPCRIIRRNLSPNYLGPVYQHHQHIVCLGDTTPTLRTVKYRPTLGKMVFRKYKTEIMIKGTNFPSLGKESCFHSGDNDFVGILIQCLFSFSSGRKVRAKCCSAFKKSWANKVHRICELHHLLWIRWLTNVTMVVGGEIHFLDDKCWLPRFPIVLVCLD